MTILCNLNFNSKYHALFWKHPIYKYENDYRTKNHSIIKSLFQKKIDSV